MTVGEFLINIAVKGADVAGRTLEGVNKTVKGIASSSTEAKAALVGVVYALNKLTGDAGRRGSELTNFANLTGLSTKELQKWELAMQRAGEPAEAMTNSIKQVQQSIAAMKMGQGAPGGFAMLKAAGLDMSKIDDTFYVMQKLREFANSSKSHTAEMNGVLRTFVGDSAIGAFRNKNFSPESVMDSEILSEGSVKKLNAVNLAWTNFWNTLNLFSQNKVASFGLPFIEELNKALKLAKVWDVQINKWMKMFPELGEIIKIAIVPLGIALGAMIGPLSTLSAIIAGIIYLMGEWQKHREGNKNSLFGGKDFEGNALGKVISKFVDMSPEKLALRSMIPGNQLNPTAPVQNNTANVVVHNNGVKDAHDAAHLFKKEVSNALRQSPAQAGGF